MAGGQQLRLLLWKDYLIRKRKVITLTGIVWASAIMFSMTVVRLNIYSQDFPTCGFQARVMPTAGMLAFLQSFMCTVNNECSPLDQFDELPTYENSKLTQISRKLAPMFNDSVLDIVLTTPHAIKLLATLADVADDPAFIELSQNGLKVKNLFAKPGRVKRFVAEKFKVDNEVADSIMEADLSFQGILEGNVNRCSVTSLNETIVVENSEHLEIFMKKLCSMKMEDLQKILLDVLFEVDFHKYLTLLGDMFQKISGDDSVSSLGDMLTAVLRMARLQNFLPPEMLSIFKNQDSDFSYVPLSLLSNLMDLFKPTFGDTQAYGIIKDFADGLVIGLQYLDKIFARQRQNQLEFLGSLLGGSQGTQGLQAVSTVFHNAADVFEEAMEKDPSLDAFSIMSQVMSFIHKFLPKQTKHEILLYSTLVAKLMEAAQKVIDINTHIEQLTYNVTLRHPEAFKILKGLPPHIVGKALEALADAERTQILTSRINFPGQMFCDVYKLQTFFVVSEAEAEALKRQLCSDTWKNYVSDFIESFGVFEVKRNINNMASLLIQETLGKDTRSQLYTIEKDFQIMKNFTQALTKIDSEEKPEVDWAGLFQMDENSELMKVVTEKGHLGKQMLIVIHGALAKEIVQQNPILDFKISPYLNDVIILVSAINEQLETTKGEAKAFKEVYVDVIMTVLLTALNEEKTYKALGTYGEDMLCVDVITAGKYLELPIEKERKTKLVKALCDATIAIENGLTNDSIVSQAITTIRLSEHAMITLDWNALINNLKDLYVTLDRDYTYLFQYRTYNMDERTKTRIDSLFNETKEFWFGEQNMDKTLRLSVKLVLRFLDILDHGMFNVSGETWLKTKYAIATSAGPISIFDDTIKLVTALMMNDSYTTNLPPTTVKALSKIVPNIPQLTMDSVDIILRDDTDVNPIISLLNAEVPWPCSPTSISDLLQLSPPSKEAVRGIEAMLCMASPFLEEWMDYLKAKNNTVKIPPSWNSTDYQPHLFLTFSASFDALVEDIIAIKDVGVYSATDSFDGHLGFKEAVDYAVKALNTTERDVVMRKAFSKMDIVINSLNESSIPGDVSMNNLWERFSKCINTMDDSCRLLGRKAWKSFLESLSIILENMATDLLTYSKEVNEPDANILQMFGFTRSTGLYNLYEKMPEFIGVLLNSYWDFGFMSQVRRASLSEFWDCEAVVSSMVIPEGSVIDEAFMKKVQPFLCPTLLHWISLPRGDNTLLDIFSKPQYYFFTIHVDELTSRFESAYTKAVELADYMTELSKKNQTQLTEEDVKMEKMQAKLEQVVDEVLTFKFNVTDPSYRLFNEINMKQFAANVYLTRIVSIISKLSDEINNLDVNNIYEGTDEERKAKISADLNVIKYLFRRKPTDAINIHFDLLTDVLWTNNENYTLVDAFDKMCSNLQANTSKTILVSNERSRGQLCAKEYRAVYSAVQHLVVKDYETARNSLMYLVDTLNTEGGQVTDVFEFLSNRKHLINNLRTSTKHSYDLSIPIYLKYLQSNIQSYNVILSFLAGEDWWTLLRNLYNGPYASKFLGYMEKSFEVVEDVLNNFDEIHLVRLLHDVDINQTESFCLPNITLSDYIPDRTGLWSDLKRQLCTEDKTELYKELPPLLFASQGYETSLKIPREIDYNSLDEDINKIESRLDLIRDGPKQPLNPSWVTDEKIQHVRTVATQLLSKQSLTKLSFAVIGNVVDAGTLFLNKSQCNSCSELTTWFKQLNLQLVKKQEYDNLLCHLPSMSLEDVHQALKNDFHWDMAIRELILTRNYTKYEMNKSLNEFLGQVKMYLLEDLGASSTKLTDCIARNVSRNEIGNATLFVSVLSHTTKLIRAELPHLQEVEGIKDTQYLKELASEVAHNLDVLEPLQNYLMEKNLLHGELMKIVNDHDVVAHIEKAHVNLRKIRSISSSDQNVIVPTDKMADICNKYNCSEISDVIKNTVNKTLVGKTLPSSQMEQFWRFDFVSSILQHIGEFTSHGARLMGLASKLDVHGIRSGRLSAMIDAMMLLITDEALDDIMFSLQGVTTELRPLLQNSSLERDLDALGAGLAVVRQIKNYMLEESNLVVQVSQLFPDADEVEASLSALGINNTNFWSIAAPRLHAGQLQLKPLLMSKLEDSHVSRYVCQMEPMSKVLSPADLDVVSAEDVFGAVIEQFCQLPDETAKQVVPALFRSFNFTFVLDKVVNILLTNLYTASNLTQEEGSSLLAQFPQMAALMPVMQENLQDLTQLFANESVFQSMTNFNTLGNLLTSPDYFSSAGMLMCGKPFEIRTHRLFTTLITTEDFATEPDQAQLEILPTEFCRSTYKQIINVDGGKIAWTFLKPLIMGKILYTPPTPTVTKIIQKANETFATMIKTIELIHSFAATLPAVDRLAAHREGILVMQRLFTMPQARALRGTFLKGAGELELPDLSNMDEMFERISDPDGIRGLLTQVSDLLHCINFNRFQASESELTMTHEAAQLSRVNEFSAGVVFMNSDELDESLTNVEYKIRMDIENVPTTARIKDYLWIPGPDSSFIEHMRYFRGFVLIQDIVDRAIITLTRDARPKRDVEEKQDWAVYAQQTPYPCYTKDNYQTSVYESQTLVVAFFFSLLFTVASTVRFIVSDKETGNTMLMSVMGVDLRWHTLSWFVASFLEMLVTTIIVTLTLYLGNVLPRTDPTLMFTLIFVFGLSVISFCYMLSKMFTSASLAATFTAILYLVSFMPFIIILSLEAVLYSSLKTFVCLSMSSSLCYSLLYVTRYEARGTGAGWGDIWDAPGEGADMSIGRAALMMCLDALIYFIIGWLIDRYFGIKTIKSSISHCVTTEEKAGVSIVNVTKVYGARSRRPKVALDNVSIELHKGQITTLLGHNGAGKTTLIKILTGMLKPTKGHVTVRSARAGTRLGVCPQRDVLLEYMSAREHVQLYAQLKSGLSASEVQHEVDKMLQVLSLGPVASEPVTRLSGGTRRRLCVALAFIGSPHLVTLDEPTAGVDPAARRDIWSMIVKLKEDRTILLTTHHLDEAELLSDQIVIMHKGQIHTTGSPIEIKRTLGNGYKLTVTYPTRDPEQEESWEVPSQEESTKQLLTVVRDVVKNANVVDVNGLEVEIVLPFFDANGLNNNFLQLCTVLEASQSALGFKNYTLDCSSLEQVFFNICQQADAPQNGIEYVPEGTPSKSASQSSVRHDRAELVPADGPLRGTAWEQFLALMHVRYVHHTRNRWLLFMLIMLPAMFITLAMGFSMLRPPADNEVVLKLDDNLYAGSTDFLVPEPSMTFAGDLDPSFAETVMQYLMENKQAKNWTPDENPQCKCGENRQLCDITANQSSNLPELMVLPDATTLNHWLVDTQEIYIEKRYSGFTSALKNNLTNLVAWYNNKGHHALPATLNTVNNAIFRAVANVPHANITTYSHPFKISKEQLSKSNIYQHIADAGISSLILLAYCLVSAGASIYVVRARRSQEKRLQLLCGVSPGLYWGTALVWDMLIMAINISITASLMLAFGFPVFVERNNLPAICITLILYGYACGSLIHVAEKFFGDASIANMVLFCLNAFLGLAFMATLLMFDVISESDATDNARWWLHKLFMLAPQFALGDALLDIAKNTIQAQVLSRFGMDTYKDPLGSSLLVLHFSYLLVMGTVLLALNIAIEYNYFDSLLLRIRPEIIPPREDGELEPVEVSAERTRVHATHAHHAPLRVNTIGNINRGFVHTEGKKGSLQRVVSPSADAAQCVQLAKSYATLFPKGQRVALRDLTLGIPPGQCTALLGQNGAGKSTTFSMLTGEVRPTSGQLVLNNQPVTSTQLCTGLISYCPQSDAIDPLLTVNETLRFYCRLRGITDQEEVIRRTVEMFDLGKYADVRSGTLSGGNKRKLCTAIAFMARSSLVLLDEPTSGMDPVSRACVARGVVAACARARGVLLSTHALDDARRLAARVALLRHGELVALAPLDECLNRFGGGYVVQCRTPRAPPRSVWRRVRARAAAAVLRVLHQHTLHFLMPSYSTVDEKEVTTSLSDIFRLMAELQSTCDIEDYTVNQSSLEQMFLSFTDKSDIEMDAVDLEPLPTPETIKIEEELAVVTAL